MIDSPNPNYECFFLKVEYPKNLKYSLFSNIFFFNITKNNLKKTVLKILVGCVFHFTKTWVLAIPD